MQKSEHSTENAEKTRTLPKFYAFAKKNMKTIITFAFVALVCVAVYSDWSKNGGDTLNTDYLYTAALEGESSKILGEATLVDSTKPENSPITEVAAGGKDLYFADASAERERKRDEALQTLQTVVDSSETMPDVKDKALSEMVSIASDMEKESNVESVVRAKGFEDCLAVISGENINIIVKTSGLLTNEVAQIREIAMNETGMAAENIKIIEKN